MQGITRVMDLLTCNIRNWKTLGVIPEKAKISFSTSKTDGSSATKIIYRVVIDYDYTPIANKLEIIELCMQEAFGESHFLSVKRLPSFSDAWDVIFYPVEIIIIAE